MSDEMSMVSAVLGTALATMAVCCAIFTWVSIVMTRREQKRLKETMEAGYRMGVCQGLIWPHATDMDPEVREEIDASTARYFVNTLNDAYKADPVATAILFGTEVAVSKEMIKHKSIPVSGGGQSITLSPIGIVNGLLPLARNRYRVAACYDSFGMMKGFKAYDMETGTFLETTDAPTRTDPPTRTRGYAP